VIGKAKGLGREQRAGGISGDTAAAAGTGTRFRQAGIDKQMRIPKQRLQRQKRKKEMPGRRNGDDGGEMGRQRECRA